MFLLVFCTCLKGWSPCAAPIVATCTMGLTWTHMDSLALLVCTWIDRGVLGYPESLAIVYGSNSPGLPFWLGNGTSLYSAPPKAMHCHSKSIIQSLKPAHIYSTEKPNHPNGMPVRWNFVCVAATITRDMAKWRQMIFHFRSQRWVTRLSRSHSFASPNKNQSKSKMKSIYWSRGPTRKGGRYHSFNTTPTNFHLQLIVIGFLG